MTDTDEYWRREEYMRRAGHLYRRGLAWQLCSDLRMADDEGLLAKVETLSDDELRDLNRLDAAWRTK